jgi:hypothetical protein
LNAERRKWKDETGRSSIKLGRNSRQSQPNLDKDLLLGTRRSEKKSTELGVCKEGKNTSCQLGVQRSALGEAQHSIDPELHVPGKIGGKTPD